MADAIVEEEEEDKMLFVAIIEADPGINFCDEFAETGVIISTLLVVIVVRASVERIARFTVAD